ncbi:MAG: hypothetical protein JW953_16730 [Anaerolineae bacterium]|nr:hypothetical protein [Anaerolineae bacterium]
MHFKFLAKHNPSPIAPNRAWVYPNLLLLLVYFLLAIALTWPTITHPTTHLPGDGADDPALAWNLWWVKYALLNAPQNPFQTDFIFYPIGINLAFYTLTALNAVTALPLTLNGGVIIASNLHMLFTFMLGGYGAFLLVRYILSTLPAPDKRPPGAENTPDGSLLWFSAAMAGGFYVFASSKLFYVALGQFNIASSHWIPLAALYILRTGHHPRRLKEPFMAGLFLTFQAWAEMTYASFMVVFIGLYWVYGLGRYALRKWRNPAFAPAASPLLHLRAALVMGFTLALGLSPILAQMLPDMLAEGDFMAQGAGFADAFSADLFGFVIPTMRHPLLGHLVAQTGIHYSIGQHIFIGLVLLGLLLVSLVTGYRYARIRFWLIAAFVFALLCLGPVVTIKGQATSLPGPFVVLQSLPFFKGNRYPSRYSVMLLLSLSVLAGFALVQIGHWLGERHRLSGISSISVKPQIRHTPDVISSKQLTAYVVFFFIFLLFLFEHLSLPLPQSDMRLPPPYRLIAAEAEDFTVLDLPLAWRNGFRVTGPLTTQFMFGQFYQTTHQKSLLQGNTSRNPEFKFQYFTNAPIINSLLALETGKSLPPARQAADRVIAAQVLDFFNIKYIVVRPDFSGNPGVTPQAAMPYIEAVFPVQKIHNETNIIVYRVEHTNQESSLRPELLIKTGSPLAPLYFGEGWGLLSPGRPLTAQRREARLLLPLRAGAQQITLHIRLPDETIQATPQSVSLALNGWQSPPQSFGAAWQEITFDLPAGIVQPGLNDLRLHFAGVTKLPFPGPNTPPLDVTVLSAGQEVGSFGHIFVNGHQVSPNQRGYNVALIQANGDIRAAHFDTHLDPAASAGLAGFIEAAPPQEMVVATAADEASASLSQEAAAALQSLGARGDLRGCFRCSHALIGQTGQTGGAAIELLDPLRPVGLTTAWGLTEPAVAAVVDWIRVEGRQE